LQELAAKTGLSASTISKIEAGVISPGYETIVALAEGLGVEPAEFFKPAVDSVPVGRRGVTRAGEGVEHASAHYTYKVQAADLLRKDFLPLVVTIRSRSVEEFDELPAHRGEEFVYVISGEVHLFTSQYEPLVLREGDSVYFNSAGGHALVSVGEHDAKVVWVCSQIGAGELADKGAQA
jgi:transcriptional regulator with XRE-family HTH domain